MSIITEGKPIYGCYLLSLLGSEFGKDNFYADYVTLIVIVMVSLLANLLIKPALLFLFESFLSSFASTRLLGC